MLEGLEIREINFEVIRANKDCRIDSDFYTKAILKNPNLIYKKIGDCILLSQYGISVSMNENRIGYPIFRMNEIHDMLCDLEVGKYADISEEEYNIFELKHRDVLFNRTNSFEWVGRTGIYYQWDEVKRTFASYLVKFQTDENIILPEYLVAFLNTSYGIREVKRRARQSINQTNVNPEEVKEIEIPILIKKIQYKIRECFDSGNYFRLKAKQLYNEAESLLLQELGLNNWKPLEDTITTKTFGDHKACGRLDAEYYQPKYYELFQKLFHFVTKRLGDIVNIVKSIEPGSEAYQREGIPFIRVANLTKFGISGSDVYLDESYNDENLNPKKDTILLTKDGSVGIAYKVEEDLKIITSGAILHLCIKDKSFKPDYLTLILNSIIVKMQAERDAGGSIIQHWKPSEIENVVVPKLPENIQESIVSKVQQSFTLKTKSKQLLDLAKTAVEIAIEQGEEQAIKLLNNHAQ